MKRNKKILINLDEATFNKLEEIAEHERQTLATTCYNLLFDNIDQIHAQVMARACIRYNAETGYHEITIKED